MRTLLAVVLEYTGPWGLLIVIGDILAAIAISLSPAAKDRKLIWVIALVLLLPLGLVLWHFVGPGR